MFGAATIIDELLAKLRHVVPPADAVNVLWTSHTVVLAGDADVTLGVRWDAFPDAIFDATRPGSVLQDEADTDANVAQPVLPGEHVVVWPEVFAAANNDTVGMRPLEEIRWSALHNGNPVAGMILQTPSGMQAGAESAGGYARQWHASSFSTRPLLPIHLRPGERLQLVIANETTAPVVGAQYAVKCVVRGYRWTGRW